jgi:hypothetical protein
MTTKQKREQPEEVDRPADKSRDVLIGQQVMDVLGEPDGLFRVQICHLWESSYRVNIFVGPNSVEARIVNSHFLKVDDEGMITASTPRMKRQYEPRADGPADGSPV